VYISILRIRNKRVCFIHHRYYNMSWIESFWSAASYESQDNQSTWNESQEWKNTVSQADVVRVREWQKKAKQVQWQIAQSKKNNDAIAVFLAYMFKHLSNDALLLSIHSLFFTKVNPNSGSKSLKNMEYSISLVALFVPFFEQKAEELWLKKVFAPLYTTKNGALHVSDYVKYVQAVFVKYKLSFLESSKEFSWFIVAILVEFGVVNPDQLGEEKTQELHTTLHKEFSTHVAQHTQHTHVHTHTHDAT